MVPSRPSGCTWRGGVEATPPTLTSSAPRGATSAGPALPQLTHGCDSKRSSLRGCDSERSSLRGRVESSTACPVLHCLGCGIAIADARRPTRPFAQTLCPSSPVSRRPVRLLADRAAALRPKMAWRQPMTVSHRNLAEPAQRRVATRSPHKVAINGHMAANSRN